MRLVLFILILAPFLLSARGIEDAKMYHANSEMQWNIAMETIDLIPWIGSEKVLDIGCGDGKITALLSKKVLNGFVIGCDISQSMIDFASSRYSQDDYPNLTFQQQEATKISFDSQFDRIVSFSALHWVLDQEKALRAIHRALVPGGKICIQTYGEGIMTPTCISDQLIQTEKWKPYFSLYTKQRIFFTEQEYEDLLEKVGFQEVQVMGSWSKTLFSNRQALIDFIRPVLNFIRHLPEDLQQEFIEDVVDKIIAIAGSSDDGTICLKTYSIQALGIKVE